MRTERIAAVLLAAGTSSRFGEEDKLMADLRGKPVAAHTLETVASMAFAELVAVARPIELAPVIHRKLERRGYTILVNDRPEEGISGSIVRAVEHVMPIRRVRGILICLADMPNIPPSHYNRVCLAAEDIRSVVASTDGFSSSPPAFIGRKHFPELLALKGDQGARALLSHGIQIETSGAVLHDIDTVDDLQTWRSVTPS
ncbi:nucleotidyltransferase family protein [Sphingobium sp. CCH11-B1]|jgi:molybdenum cofactor cytidylyltransferase|uniref:nucleotidyltransferase family protein n=1 Tax=Sphingobium sp. CCH11-B1 TaxID=1768781 RepID=UPI00082F5646|nr:nucleotidyltransferase family protein [Sphingobium sp. CCH11-B1]MEA3390445.1 nucleotidyltransferase family protein [Pseudomonadota bacterium]